MPISEVDVPTGACRIDFFLPGPFFFGWTVKLRSDRLSIKEVEEEDEGPLRSPLLLLDAPGVLDVEDEDEAVVGAANDPGMSLFFGISRSNDVGGSS